jgi:hypothetical protein
MERFWAKVKKTESCWLWEGGMRPGGYGTFMLKYKQTLAHRYAYESLVGPLAEGTRLTHSCGVRHCVNPKHLTPCVKKVRIRVAGTHADPRMGEGHKNAKLRDGDATAMKVAYVDGEAVAVLAKKYGIHPMTVYKILDGKHRNTIRERVGALRRKIALT